MLAGPQDLWEDCLMLQNALGASERQPVTVRVKGTP